MSDEAEPKHPKAHSPHQSQAAAAAQTDDLSARAMSSIRRAMFVSTGLLVLIALMSLVSYYAFRTTTPGSGAAAVAAQPLPATTPPAAVSITGSGFSPATVSVKAGQAVVWTNSDSKPHFVTSDDPKPTGNTPDPKSGQAIAAGGSYDYVFSKAGTYTYHDDLNPGSGFKGVVVVK